MPESSSWVQEAGATLNSNKCAFGKSQHKFLATYWIKMAPELAKIKRQPSLKWNNSQVKNNLKGFIGKMNKLRKFSSSVAELLQPSRQLFSKKTLLLLIHFVPRLQDHHAPEKLWYTADTHLQQQHRWWWNLASQPCHLAHRRADYQKAPSEDKVFTYVIQYCQKGLPDRKERRVIQTHTLLESSQWARCRQTRMVFNYTKQRIIIPKCLQWKSQREGPHRSPKNYIYTKMLTPNTHSHVVAWNLAWSGKHSTTAHLHSESYSLQATHDPNRFTSLRLSVVEGRNWPIPLQWSYLPCCSRLVLQMSRNNSTL